MSDPATPQKPRWAIDPNHIRYDPGSRSIVLRCERRQGAVRGDAHLAALLELFGPALAALPEVQAWRQALTARYSVPSQPYQPGLIPAAEIPDTHDPKPTTRTLRYDDRQEAQRNLDKARGEARVAVLHALRTAPTLDRRTTPQLVAAIVEAIHGLLDLLFARSQGDRLVDALCGRTPAEERAFGERLLDAMLAK